MTNTSFKITPSHVKFHYYAIFSIIASLLPTGRLHALFADDYAIVIIMLTNKVIGHNAARRYLCTPPIDVFEADAPHRWQRFEA